MAKYEVKAFPMYDEEHTWIRKMLDDTYKIGVSDYAQKQQGEIVYVELPEEGDQITKGESFGSIESNKAVSELIAPVSGTVTSVNEDVLDEPGIINSSCYDSGWLITVEPEDYEGDKEKLMDAENYRSYLDGLE
jgi:glycine cleavage system H protein